MHTPDPSVYHIIGMSPGNSYFKDEEVEYLLKTIVGRFGRVAIMIADVPAISTYIALGYPENRARRDKAIPQGKALKNRVVRIMAKLGYTDEMVRIFDWGQEIESNSDYKKSYQQISELFENNEKFRETACSTTRAVLEASQRTFADIESATITAVHYLLSELAFLEFVPHYLKTSKIIYIYHKNWEIFENYIAGTYDGIVRPYLDFLLLENPYETFNPIWGLEEKELNGEYKDVLDRVEKTGILRVGFTNYVPAFMYDRTYDNFSGIFYEVIVHIAKTYGWSIRWTEETGYGVITDALENNRFDMFGSAVWPIPERKSKADFSVSLYKSSVYPWVRADYGKTIDEIRLDEHIRLAMKENDITDSIAQADFPDNRRVRVPQLADTIELLKFVTDNRADFTFVEPYTAEYFNEQSAIIVVPAANKPVRVYDNAFIIKKGEERLKELFDKELIALKNNGFISKLIRKYTGSEETFVVE